MLARSAAVLARAASASRQSSTLAATATKTVTASTPAAAAKGASASITTAATAGTLGSSSSATAKHVNYAGKVMSRSRHFSANASESLPGLSFADAAAARSERAARRLRDAKHLAGI